MAKRASRFDESTQKLESRERDRHERIGQRDELNHIISMCNFAIHQCRAAGQKTPQLEEFRAALQARRTNLGF